MEIELPTITSVHSPSDLDSAYDIIIPDTNILLSFPFLIPSPTSSTLPSTSSIDFNHTHIVIPSVIDDELDHLKGQHISISVSARNAIRRLEKLSESYQSDFSLSGSFELRNNLRIQYTDAKTRKNVDMLFSFWSVENDISVPPFYPIDPDGKIIASALKIRDTPWYKESSSMFHPPEVTLLSNDHNFRFRARNFGIPTSSYDLLGPTAHSGRRTVDAPRVLYTALIRDHSIPGRIWRQYMPNEAPLYPNDFVVFRVPQPKKKTTPPKNTKRKHGRPIKPPVTPPPAPSVTAPQKPSERFAFIGRYDADLDEIVGLKYLDRSPVEPENIGQAIHVEAMMNPKLGVVIVDNNPHYKASHVAVVSYRTKEPAFTDDIYDAFDFS